MKLKYMCYDVLMKNSGSEMTAVEVAEILNVRRHELVHAMLLHLAENYIKIYAKKRGGEYRFWWKDIK